MSADEPRPRRRTALELSDNVGVDGELHRAGKLQKPVAVCLLVDGNVHSCRHIGMRNVERPTGRGGQALECSHSCLRCRIRPENLRFGVWRVVQDHKHLQMSINQLRRGVTLSLYR